MTTQTEWRWCDFESLSNTELYEILKLRQEVFIVEQNVPYNDNDDLDYEAWHLAGWQMIDGKKACVACLRVTLPGKRFEELSIGRVATAQSVRGQGLGKEMTRICLEKSEEKWGKQPIRISAQDYLQKFYGDFGFQSVGEVYIEEERPHIQMLRP